MKILSQLLANQDPASFLQKYFTRLPYSAPHNARDLLHLLDWKVVEQVINKKKSILRIVKDGVMIKDHTTIGFQESMNYYLKGHTLLLKNAEHSHPALSELALDFSSSFYTPVDIQLYCTPEGHNAFDWHYDVEEVFIIQTKGSKEYTIRQNTFHPQPLIQSIPEDLGYENETSDLSIKVLLTEGDWLYIPSGWWHKAETKSESMHISIGLMPKAAVDFTSFLPQYLSQFPFWRQRVPLLHKLTKEEEKQFYREAMQKLGDDLKEKFSSDLFLEFYLDNVRRAKVNNTVM